MVEFTGERIIPGKVDEDLYHQHFSRYAFASRFVSGKQCLDAGCGLGYGTALLAQHGAANAVGMDFDAEAVRSAVELNNGSRALFLVADVTSLPVPARSYPFIVSFEVVEHLKAWRQFLGEVARVLSTDGLFLVSTPNKDYYALSRGDSGPNPFHEHEFTYDEFRSALGEHFAHVTILAQNEVPAFVFLSDQHESRALAEISTSSSEVASAQFYLAVCSHSPLPALPSYAYVTSSGNVLFERERHIQLLREELALKATWLRDAQRDLANLQSAHTKLESELAERSRWAISATEHLEAENRRLADALEQKCGELATTVEKLHAAEATVIERSEWAKRLNAHIDELTGRISQFEDEISSLSTSVTGRQRTLQELKDDLASLELRRRLELRQLATLLGVHPTENSLSHHLIATRIEAFVSDLNRQKRQLDLIRNSRWIRLGRLAGMGPKLEDDSR